MRALVAFVVLAASPSLAAVDKNAAGLVTELVTAALAREPRFNVLAAVDVRRQVEVELVVYGKLGTLDDVILLTLHLFDTKHAQAAGRVVVRATSLSGVSDHGWPRRLMRFRAERSSS